MEVKSGDSPSWTVPVFDIALPCNGSEIVQDADEAYEIVGRQASSDLLCC